MSPSASQTYVVVGAGVVGLSTALELQRRRPGARVVVAAKFFPGDRSVEYCSPWAGANWASVTTDEHPLHQWEAETYRRFAALSDAVPGAAVQRMGIRTYFDRPLEETGLVAKGASALWYEALVGGTSPIPARELPEGVCFGLVLPTFVINTQSYLAW